MKPLEGLSQLRNSIHKPPRTANIDASGSDLAYIRLRTVWVVDWEVSPDEIINGVNRSAGYKPRWLRED